VGERPAADHRRQRESRECLQKRAHLGLRAKTRWLGEYRDCFKPSAPVPAAECAAPANRRGGRSAPKATVATSAAAAGNGPTGSGGRSRGPAAASTQHVNAALVGVPELNANEQRRGERDDVPE